MMKNCVLKPSVDTFKWFKKTAIRCVRTFAATVVSLLPTTAAALATVIIFFTCVAGIPEVEDGE